MNNEVLSKQGNFGIWTIQIHCPIGLNMRRINQYNYKNERVRNNYRRDLKVLFLDDFEVLIADKFIQ